jgi:Malectin domain
MDKFLFVITAATLLARCHTLDIVFAVNCGGPAYTSENGITYEADTNSKGQVYSFGEFIGVVGPDLALYKKLRARSFDYTLPVTGDGWYGLVLHEINTMEHFPEYEFDLKLDAITLLESYSPTKECLLYHVCNKVIYFAVCNNVVHYNGSTAQVHDNKMKLYFPENAPVHAILMAKGVAGECQTVITNGTRIFFDPADERKCVKA